MTWACCTWAEPRLPVILKHASDRYRLSRFIHWFQLANMQKSMRWGWWVSTLQSTAVHGNEETVWVREPYKGTNGSGTQTFCPPAPTIPRINPGIQLRIERGGIYLKKIFILGSGRAHHWSQYLGARGRQISSAVSSRITKATQKNPLSTKQNKTKKTFTANVPNLYKFYYFVENEGDLR